MLRQLFRLACVTEPNFLSVSCFATTKTQVRFFSRVIVVQCKPPQNMRTFEQTCRGKHVGIFRSASGCDLIPFFCQIPLEGIFL